MLDKVETLQGTLIPADVQIDHHAQLRRDRDREIQRTAVAHDDRDHLGVAADRCWRWAGASRGSWSLAIPATLALTLLVFYLYGYTLNRITLFALIFSIGILVDDAIVVVENIVRHFRLPENKGRPLMRGGGRGGG